MSYGLRAGAAATPKGNGAGPIDTAIELNSRDGVRLLLDFHADPNVAQSTRKRPVHIALDMERFRIAARAEQLGWPSPMPSPHDGHALARTGKWPPVPKAVVALMRKAAASKAQP